ncbi:MAG: antitoxin [Elusimicrobia bacterium RIFOXYB2_FULL_48_7]|nr:MAG: antitoxin [Elusimicrobia bacterium RIFOXYB2_FULL_48_7]
MDKHEKELLKSYENGEWITVKDFEKKKKVYVEYARNTLKKDRRLNIRISNKDLEGIQRIAVREGIPYQTLVSSIIHKFVLAH